MVWLIISYLIQMLLSDYNDGKNEMTIHRSHCEPWKVTVVDTGLNTMTGGRIKRIQKICWR